MFGRPCHYICYVIELPVVGPGQVPDSENGVGVAVEVDLDFVPSKTVNALELDMGDGLVIYDHGTGLVHHLNHAAGIIWHLSDGDATTGDLARDIATEYGRDLREVEEQVAQLVGTLLALGLVRGAGAPAQDQILGQANGGQEA